MKSLMQFSIDPDVALNFRRLVQSRERSKIINDFLRRFCDIDEAGETGELARKLKDAVERQRNVYYEVQELTASLAVAERRDEQQEKKEAEAVEEMGDSLRQFNRRVDDPV